MNESTEIDALLEAISAERFNTYLIAAGHDPERALRLYLWNTQIGEAFHIPIQAVEVSLRNAVSFALASKYGTDWWNNKEFESRLDEERRADLIQVLRRISNRRLTVCTGQVIAGLSFGFWVGMLHRRYNPEIWSTHMRPAFPHLPKDRGRKSLAQQTGARNFAQSHLASRTGLQTQSVSGLCQRYDPAGMDQPSKDALD